MEMYLGVLQNKSYEAASFLDDLIILHNLFNQVKKGGLLIITFDLPGLQINEFEIMLDRQLKVSENDISGSNSILINTHCSNLNCGILIIKKQ
jgi:hypothetical protein